MWKVFCDVLQKPVWSRHLSDDRFMKISTHAKERALERYGIRFSKKRCKSFGRTLRNPKWTIRLRGDRLACYFENRWLLLICKENSVVLTFLSPEDATDEDRQLLIRDEQYHRINDDVFRVLKRHSISNVTIPDIAQPEYTIDVPPMLPEEELPSDVLESAVKLMKDLCQN